MNLEKINSNKFFFKIDILRQRIQIEKITVTEGKKVK